MSTTAALPTRLPEITPEWLTSALQVGFPTTTVRAVEVESVIWGTATKVFVSVDYLRVDEGGPGRMLCIKGGFDDKLEGVHAIGYTAEARFYRDIAPAIEGVPRCWYADTDPGTGQGVIIVDDLRHFGASFGSPDDAPSLDEVADCLETMANWHAKSWNRQGVGGTPWLTVGSDLFRPVAQWFLTQEHWDEFIAKPQTEALTGELRDRERLEVAIKELWRRDDAGPLALSHGDPHVANTYITADGRRRFLDWQTVCLAPWSDDVAYFLVGILDVERRRRHEIELLRHYLGALSAAVPDAPGFEEAWRSYREHHLHGLMFALCPPSMQPAEVCAQMGQRYGAAALDHGTLGLLTSGH